MRISAIIPAYNEAARLAETIRTVIAQELPVSEIVVIDDGSTDDTYAVASRFPEVRCIRQENAGCPVARSRGADEARGDYLAFLDGDDLWTPDKLRLQAEALRAESGPAFALCHFQPVRVEGVRLPDWATDAYFGKVMPAYIPSAIFVSREDYRRVGGFRPDRPIAADVDWVARARAAGLKEVMVPRRLVLKRMHSSNLTTDLKATASDLISAIRDEVRRKRDAARQ